MIEKVIQSRRLREVTNFTSNGRAYETVEYEPTPEELERIREVWRKHYTPTMFGSIPQGSPEPEPLWKESDLVTPIIR